MLNWEDSQNSTNFLRIKAIHKDKFAKLDA